MIEGPVRGALRIPGGVKLIPPTGYRQLDARTSFFYGIAYGAGIKPPDSLPQYCGSANCRVGTVRPKR
jgi:hypothetical protein